MEVPTRVAAPVRSCRAAELVQALETEERVVWVAQEMRQLQVLAGVARAAQVLPGVEQAWLRASAVRPVATAAAVERRASRLAATLRRAGLRLK